MVDIPKIITTAVAKRNTKEEEVKSRTSKAECRRVAKVTRRVAKQLIKKGSAILGLQALNFIISGKRQDETDAFWGYRLAATEKNKPITSADELPRCLRDKNIICALVNEMIAAGLTIKYLSYKEGSMEKPFRVYGFEVTK